MEKKLQSHLDEAFKPYGNAAGVKEIKQELLANLQEKFADLKTDGMNDAEAFTTTIESIGDISEIMEQLPRDRTERKVFKPNLSGTGLKGADLAGTTVRDLTVRGSDLKGANLSNAD